MSKKKLENSLLALLGVGLIVTSIVLMVQKKQSSPLAAGNEEDQFPLYDQNDRGLHVFSESGILL